jgi:hypothetical protein
VVAEIGIAVIENPGPPGCTTRYPYTTCDTDPLAADCGVNGNGEIRRRGEIGGYTRGSGDGATALAVCVSAPLAAVMLKAYTPFGRAGLRLQGHGGRQSRKTGVTRLSGSKRCVRW